MNERTWFNRFKKAGGLALAFLLSLLAGAIIAKYFDAHPSLTFELLANAKVVDVLEDSEKLQILYDGQDLQESGRTLSVVTYRVVNDGSAAIREGDYSEADPIGLVVSGGVVPEKPKVIEASEDRLKAIAIKVENAKDNLRVALPSVLLNPEDYFVFKVLVLQRSPEITPSIDIVGTIADVRIRTIVSNEPQEKGSIWADALSGGLWVQLLRLLCYAGSIAFFVAAGLYLDELRTDYMNFKTWKQMVWEYARKRGTPEAASVASLFEKYAHQGVNVAWCYLKYPALREYMRKSASFFSRRVIKKLDAHVLKDSEYDIDEYLEVTSHVINRIPFLVPDNMQEWMESNFKIPRHLIEAHLNEGLGNESEFRAVRKKGRNPRK